MQPHLTSNDGINRKGPPGEYWLTSRISSVCSVSVHADIVWGIWLRDLIRLTGDGRGSSHNGEEGQEGKAKAMPSHEDGHHDKLSC